MFDQARFDLYNYDAVIAPVHFKCVFAKSNLVFFAKGEMMPRHFHGKIGAVIAAEEFIEFGTAAIKLPQTERRSEEPWAFVPMIEFREFVS